MAQRATTSDPTHPVAPRSDMKPCVVAPTFNNAGTLVGVLVRAAAQGLPIIVVNDGSTDATAALLDEWRQTATVPVSVLTHPRNRGKSAALQAGFARARAHGFTHAVTIDTDGQLDPEQIPEMLAASAEAPDAMVVGTRDISRPDYPPRSRFGRRVSNLLIWMESGVGLSDSQCGFRVYPLSMFDGIRGGAARFAFESEVIVRAAWRGVPIVETPVNCRYFPPSERVSHFKPVRDSARVMLTHLRLLAVALMPWSPAGPAGHDGARAPVAAKGGSAGEIGFWGKVGAWASPLRLWRQVRDSNEGRERTAAAVAVGAYIGVLPVVGVQAFVGVYVARRWHLHPVAVVLGTNISVPPVGVLVIIASVWVGHAITHGHFLHLRDLSPSTVKWDLLAARFMMDWIVGSVPLGIACAVFAYFATLRLLRGIEPARPSR